MEKPQDNAANAQAMILTLILIGLVVLGFWAKGVQL